MNRYLKGIKTLFATAFPLPMLVYALLWAWGLEAQIIAESQQVNWIFSHESLIRALTVYLALLFITIVDEIKDFDYDKKYNPGRVLVKGIISHREITIFALFVGFVLVAINLPFNQLSTCLLIFNLIYASALIIVEKLSSRVSDNPVINLIVTYPVQLFLSIYIVLDITEQFELNLAIETWRWPVAVMFAYLHYEIAKKTISKNRSLPTKYYSAVLGEKGSALTAVICALLAMGISASSHAAFANSLTTAITLTFIAVECLIVLLGLRIFLEEKEKWPTSYAMGFFLLFLLSNPIQVLFS